MDATLEATQVPAAVPVPPTPVLKIRKRAIFYGICFDFFVSLAFGALCGFFYPLIVMKGMTFNYTNLGQEITTFPLFVSIFYIFGTIISIMAGYIIARVGKVRPYAHVLWAASIFFLVHLIATMTTILQLFSGVMIFGFVDMFNILALPVIFPCYLLGAYIYQHVQTSYEETLA